MDTKRLFIKLGPDVWHALKDLADRHDRDPRRQAARLIGEGLVREAQVRDSEHDFTTDAGEAARDG